MTYKYWGFGLKIVSEIEFPELLPFEFDREDLTVVLGKIPITVGADLVSGELIYHLVNDTEFFFEVKNIARYYATNGNCIIIEKDVNAVEMRVVRLYVLATVIAAILLQRNLLPFHSSAIVKDQHLLLFTGDSGAGKSTAIAGLIKKGYTIFSDDVVVLKKNGGGIIAGMASYPMIKLWDDTMVKLKYEMFEARSFAIKPGIDKFGIFFHKNFNQGHYPVEKIFILKKEECDEIATRELNGAEAFKAITEQIYRPVLQQSYALKGMSFVIITMLLKTCRVYEITRPVNGSIENMITHLDGLLCQSAPKGSTAGWG